ncbi:MAG TPA: hypothetical protein VIW80_02245 [Pyrinomonadaceae bacterium]|jgi:hypothetical protein
MPVSQSVKFEIPEKKVYEALPANVYQVQITDISDKLKSPYGKPFDIPDEEKETFLTFEFTILNEGEYGGRKLWKDMRPVPPTPPEGNFKASWMYRLVSAVQGSPVTFANGVNWGAEETNALIGQQLRIVVTKTEKGEKTYNNITEVLPIEKPLEPKEVSNEVEVPSGTNRPATGQIEANASASPARAAMERGMEKARAIQGFVKVLWMKKCLRKATKMW